MISGVFQHNDHIDIALPPHAANITAIPCSLSVTIAVVGGILMLMVFSIVRSLIIIRLIRARAVHAFRIRTSTNCTALRHALAERVVVGRRKSSTGRDARCGWVLMDLRVLRSSHDSGLILVQDAHATVVR